MAGCGAQLGMLFALTGLTFVVLCCGFCLMVNVLTIGLTQELAGRPTPAAAKAGSPSGEIGSLLGEVDSLLAEVEFLQPNAPAAKPASAAYAGKPVVMAGQDQVPLYSGPGIQYDRVGLLSPGETLEIAGRNTGSTWWLLSKPDGLFAWTAAGLVTALNIDGSIPVVTTPSQLGQPAASGPLVAVASPTPSPTVSATSTPALPLGTPTPAADLSRQFVEELPAYKRVKASLLTPPVSESFSPDGSRIAMTERIKVYTIGIAGAHTDIWLENNNDMGPMGWVVWSPDGEYLAFTVGFKNPHCRPCVSVVLLRLSDGKMTFLQALDNLDTDAPRWTQDGRILVNVHPGEPAKGTAYVYNIYGEGQPAEGIYTLSTSHEGQKWFPWRPGRVWRAGVSERPDSYVGD